MPKQKLEFSVFDKVVDFIRKSGGTVRKGKDAVENAVASPLSNGYVEGTNNKIKMKKRVMYGRCGIELLSAKLMLKPKW